MLGSPIASMFLREKKHTYPYSVCSPLTPRYFRLLELQDTPTYPSRTFRWTTSNGYVHCCARFCFCVGFPFIGCCSRLADDCYLQVGVFNFWGEVIFNILYTSNILRFSIQRWRCWQIDAIWKVLRALLCLLRDLADVCFGNFEGIYRFLKICFVATLWLGIRTGTACDVRLSAYHIFDFTGDSGKVWTGSHNVEKK